MQIENLGQEHFVETLFNKSTKFKAAKLPRSRNHKLIEPVREICSFRITEYKHSWTAEVYRQKKMFTNFLDLANWVYEQLMPITAKRLSHTS